MALTAPVTVDSILHTVFLIGLSHVASRVRRIDMGGTNVDEQNYISLSSFCLRIYGTAEYRGGTITHHDNGNTNAITVTSPNN